MLTLNHKVMLASPSADDLVSCTWQVPVSRVSTGQNVWRHSDHLAKSTWTCQAWQAEGWHLPGSVN